MRRALRRVAGRFDTPRGSLNNIGYGTGVLPHSRSRSPNGRGLPFFLSSHKSSRRSRCWRGCVLPEPKPKHRAASHNHGRNAVARPYGAAPLNIGRTQLLGRLLLGRPITAAAIVTVHSAECLNVMTRSSAAFRECGPPRRPRASPSMPGGRRRRRCRPRPSRARRGAGCARRLDR